MEGRAQMVLLKRFKLRSKVFIGFGLILFLLLITVIFSLSSLNRINDDFQTYSQISTDEMLVGRIQANLLESRIAFENYVQAPDAKHRSDFEKRYRKMEGFILELKNSIDNPERREVMDQILQRSSEYKDNFNRVVEYQGKREGYYNVLISNGPKLEQYITELMDSAHSYNNEALAYGAGYAMKHLLLARLNVSRYLEINNPNMIEVVKLHFAELEKWIAYMEGKVKLQSERVLLEQIKASNGIYHNNFVEIAIVISSNNQVIQHLDRLGPEISFLAENVKLSIIEEQATYGPKIKLEHKSMITRSIVVAALALVAAILISVAIARSVTLPVKAVTRSFKDISEGVADLDFRLKVAAEDELGDMAIYFNRFMERLKQILKQNQRQSWLKVGQAELNELLHGENSIECLCNNILRYIAGYIDAQIGSMYAINNNGDFEFAVAYAHKANVSAPIIKAGEGIVGQAIADGQLHVINNLPPDYLKITSSLGEVAPKYLLLMPCITNNEVKGVIELGLLQEVPELHLEFLREISESIALSIDSVNARKRLNELLQKTMNQAEELQLQQEELRQTNEELEEQTKALKDFQMQLQVQQEELRVINEELIERTDTLELQKSDLDRKNEFLLKAQQEIKQKAEALQSANTYKSEFLANMSHELRTPLNSILVLSQLLAEKKDNAPLTEKQMEFAKTINTSGSELLNLINDILDLSKVEAGKIDILPEVLQLKDFAAKLEGVFRQVVEKKGLYFNVLLEDNTPAEIITDSYRVQQIISNFLSNSIKFTEVGGITLKIGQSEVKKFNSVAKNISLSVSDTGLGIPLEKLSLIFEAFQQSDGTTSRKYGGTGLGLSIAKELTALLGGEILVESNEGVGSTFTLILPLEYNGYEASIVDSAAAFEKSNVNQNQIIDFSAIEINEVVTIRDNEPLLLIIEDDMSLSNILQGLAIKKGFNCIIAKTGEEGLALARALRPVAIILDVLLPDLDGYEVIDRLKQHDFTKHIPLHILSGDDFNSTNTSGAEVNLFLHGLNSNVVKFNKSVRTNKEKERYLEGRSILIVDDDMRNVFSLTSILEDKGVKVIVGKNGAEGLQRLHSNPEIELVIMDIMMPEMDGYTVIKEIRRDERYTKLPIIALTAKAMKEDKQRCIEAGANDYLTKPIDIDRLITLTKVWLYK